MKTLKNENRYLPQELVLKIQLSDYKRKDDLYCILDAIYRSQIYFKTELQKNYGYKEIPRSYFLDLIRKPENITLAKEFLIENGYIETNEFFRSGYKCKGYRIPREYLGRAIQVEITDININERIKLMKEAKRRMKVKNIEFKKSHYYKSFKIDKDNALKAATNRCVDELQLFLQNNNISLTNDQIISLIENTLEGKIYKIMIDKIENNKEFYNIIHRLLVHQQIIRAIADGYLFFKRNKTNGRLECNLSSLPSYLRRFIIATEELYNIDIKNSQPFFLYTLLKKETNINLTELNFYGKLVTEGEFYEFLSAKYEDSTGKIKTREYMKKMLFKIFYSKVSSFKQYKDFFRSIFPSIMNYIDMVNITESNRLAIQLQMKESFTVLDIVLPELNKLNIKPYTIHDSFLCLKSEVNTVVDTFKNICIELYGIAPALHVNNLMDEVDDRLEEMSFEEFISELNDNN
jgi:hypothetical protein